MKKAFIGLSIVIATFIFCASIVVAADEQPLKTSKDRINYAIGVNIINNLNNQGIELNVDIISKGMKDALQGGGLLLTQDDIQKAITQYQTEVRRYQSEAPARRAEIKKVGDSLLAENQKKPGVVTLPSGVQYKVVRQGFGKTPTLKDEVAIHYIISKADGKQMGSTYPGPPRTSPLAKAIPGLQEVLQLMQEGAKWQVVIPAAATGRRDPLDDIGVLIYELELVSINPGVNKDQSVSNTEGKEEP